VVGDLEDPKVHAHPLQACVRHRVVYRPGLDREDVRSMTSSKMSEPVSDVEQMLRVGRALSFVIVQARACRRSDVPLNFHLKGLASTRLCRPMNPRMRHFNSSPDLKLPRRITLR